MELDPLQSWESAELQASLEEPTEKYKLRRSPTLTISRTAHRILRIIPAMKDCLSLPSPQVHRTTAEPMISKRHPIPPGTPPAIKTMINMMLDQMTCPSAQQWAVLASGE
jgi:hypothetical protein